MAKLILLNAQGSPQQFELTGSSMKLGRSPDCQIRFDSNQFGGVSRHHATLKSIGNGDRWQFCDENSANGTFLNDQPLHGCVTLQAGDRIMLSQQGPLLRFEKVDVSPTSPYQRVQPSPPPVGSPINGDANPSLSQLIPVVSSRKNLKSFWSKGYILPGVLTVLWVVLLFFTRGNLGLFIVGLGTYLGAIGYSFIYRLCGKRKPWWEIAFTILFTMLLLMIPQFLGPYLFVFRVILPGNVNGASNNFLSLFVAHFFGAGLSEELLKAIPVFCLMYFGYHLRLRQAIVDLGRRHLGYRESRWGRSTPAAGVKEPLDGIVLAAASGLGFTLVETLVQYVPGEIIRVSNTLGGSDSAIQAGQLLGIQLLVPRIIGSVAGHMAYSGYFGYFIGLSVLFPRRRWLILAIGYLTSSFLHALWNASGGTLGPFVLAFAGILSYVFLIAAILKARELSPTRSQNFATRVVPPDHSNF